MKKALFILFLFLSIKSVGQSPSIIPLKADSVIIYKSGTGGAELVIRNKTKDTLGYLYNKGNGITEFRSISSASGSTLVTTVAGLRATTSPNENTIYETTDFGTGNWYYDPSDIISTDNTGTILVAGTKRYKRIYTGSINARWFGSVSLAVTAIGSDSGTIVISSPISLSANLTIPSNVSLIIIKGGAINTGIRTLAINGTFKAERYKVFSGTGAITFGQGSTDYQFPEWDGARNDNTDSAAGTHAFALQIARATPISLGNGTYKVDSITNNGSNPLVIIGTGQQYKSILKISNTPRIGIYLGQATSAEHTIFQNFMIYGSALNKGAIALGDTSVSASTYTAYTTFNNIAIFNFTATGAYGISLNSVQELQVNGCRFNGNYNNVWRPNLGYVTSTLFFGEGTYIGTALNRGVDLQGRCFQITFRDAIFEQNIKEGLYYNFRDYSNIVIDRCYFENNATSGTGAVSVTGSKATVGPYTEGQTSLFLTNSYFYHNANVLSRQLFMDSVSNCVIMNNQGLAFDSGIVTGNVVQASFKNNHEGNGLNYFGMYHSLKGDISVDDYSPYRGNYLSKRLLMGSFLPGDSMRLRSNSNGDGLIYIGTSYYDEAAQSLLLGGTIAGVTGTLNIAGTANITKHTAGVNTTLTFTNSNTTAAQNHGSNILFQGFFKDGIIRGYGSPNSYDGGYLRMATYFNDSTLNMGMLQDRLGGILIGDTIPIASAGLAIRSTTRGFLEPVMTAAQMNAISSPATGLQVYNSDSLALCFYNGAAWLKVGSSSSASGWGLTGNSITAGTNFLGTTNNTSLDIYTNSVRTARFDSVGAQLHLLAGVNPMLSMKQKTTNTEVQLRVGVGTGVSNGNFNIYDATASKVRMVMSGASTGFGDILSIPTASKLYVYGGSAGPNIDVRPDSAVYDEGNIEVESSDYEGSSFTGYGIALQYNGNVNTGSFLGYSKKNFGQLRFTGKTNFIHVITNNSLRFATNDLEKMVLDSNGRLGIGLVSPDSVLHVVGGLKFVTGRQGAGKVLVSDANGGADWGSISSGLSGTLPATNGGTGTATYTTGDILYASATNTLSKLAIGATGKKLTVVGGIPAWVDSTASQSALSGTGLLSFSGTTPSYNTTSASILGIISDETGSGSMVFGTSPTFTTGITSALLTGGTGTTSPITFKTTTGVGTTGADMIFQVGNNGATEAMRILNSGAISALSYMTLGAGSGAAVGLTPGGPGLWIDVNSGSPSNTNYSISSSGGDTRLNAITGHNLVFRINNSTIATLSSPGNLSMNGSLTFPTAGTGVFVTTGAGSRAGDATLVAGTIAVTITGLTTSSRAQVTRTVAANTTLTTGITAVCTANTLTITADLAAGTINTADTSTYTYFIVN